MKKIILTLCFLQFHLFIYSQSIGIKDTINWSELEYHLTNDRKYKLLSNIEEDLFFFLKDNSLLKDKLDDFHFIDLDNDGKKDFIYVGFSGSENISTLIFIQEGKGFFKKVFEKEGYISSLRQLVYSKCVLEIKIISNDNCYDCLSSKNITTYVVNNGKVEKLETLAYNDNIHLPRFSFKKKFVVTASSYNLRDTPNIINTKSKSSDYLFGNVIAVYKKGASGFAYAKKDTSDGRMWWFVILKGTNSKESVFDNKNCYYIGWMSNKFLKEE